MAQPVSLTTFVQGEGLRLPALVEARIHQTRTWPNALSFTHDAPLWLADLDQPLRLSRWSHPFGTRELPRFQEDALAHTKAEILDVAGRAHSDDHVIMLSTPATTAAPASPISAFWCLTDAGQVTGSVVELHNVDGASSFFVASESTATAGTIVTGDQQVEAHGRVRTSISPERVAVGLQLFDTNDAPLVTASLTGAIRPATVRSLMQSASRAQAAVRLAA